MAEVAMIVAAAGTIFSGLTAHQTARYQASVARNNAEIARQQAQSASDANQETQRRSDIESAATMGQIEAAQSASGLDMLGRSQLAVRQRTAAVGRMAAGDIRREGQAEVEAIHRQEQGFRSAAMMASRDATNILVNTAFDVAKVAAPTGGTSKGGPSGDSSLVGGSSSTKKTRPKAGA